MGEMVAVVVVEVDWGESLELLGLVIPRAEAKAWVSKEGPDCLGRGPGPRAFLLLEAPGAWPLTGATGPWTASLALASPRGT